ncbi:MAG: carboxyl transferase domain-containing protein, partial [Tepidiformaceae bacterium]
MDAPTSLPKLLVANRGEIAVRVLRAASDMGMRTVAVYSIDDAESLHVNMADESRLLEGAGPAAYLDAAQIVAVAAETGRGAIHPGYGFLSENAAFARLCGEAGITFVGPRVELLELFGDKMRAREVAVRAGVPVLPGSERPATLEDAQRFFALLREGEAMMLKAASGGGGRGMRLVDEATALEQAFARCQSEARAAFGDGALYVERLLPEARHIEVQVIGDGTGDVSQLGERDCSLQRRHQKLVEIAPAPGLPTGLRERILAAALSLAGAVRYDNIGTFEFLVDASAPLSDATPFFFIEANPRLQVEHTVTEQVTGLDLVRIQLELAQGSSLAELGLRAHEVPRPRGFAIEARVNMETMGADGQPRPTGGTLEAFAPPSGPGVRVDTFGYAGYRTSQRFDSLLAKVIGSTARGTFNEAAARTRRALGEFRIEGVATNIPFLQALLASESFRDARITTRYIDRHIAELVQAAAAYERRPAAAIAPAATPRAGAKVDANDPLAVLTYGKPPGGAFPGLPLAGEPPAPAEDGTTTLVAPVQGTVVSVYVHEGDAVRAGQALVILESMKMEHEVKALTSGIVRRIAVVPGDTIYQGHVLLLLEDTDGEAAEAVAEEHLDLDEIRPDLEAVLARRALTRDSHRPDAVARRRRTGQRTARENIEDLCDPGSFVEYGALVLAAQRSRRSLEELIVKSPADGMITGVGRINGDLFPDPDSSCVVLSYDYTVFAGTQGAQNHRKTDRIIDVAESGRMPVVLFAEGGGGRPGDTDGVATGGGGSTRTFARFAQLSGLVPMVGITSGRCFAGNASLLGCCDVIIATANSNIGMGGPAMIEGGGLGVFAPEEIGPMAVQVPNGVVDIAVADEAEAVRVAKHYLSYFQGPLLAWESADQRRMRRIIPENRLRVYDVRAIIATLADTGSVLELRPSFGVGMITSLARVEGKPLGIIANNPMHLGGGTESQGDDKARK